jgi:hypothetical protein
MVTNMLGAKRIKIILIGAICLAIAGCDEHQGSYNHRDFTEYSLDEKSFDAEAMEKIEKESEIDIPPDSKGLAFHHIPPIDPIVFAKIKIPADAQNTLIKQLEALTFSGTQFPKNFANDRCKWWPIAPKGVILSKQAFKKSYFMELLLVKEDDDIILYIKYFTI